MVNILSEANGPEALHYVGSAYDFTSFIRI
jgi:hypothetical protein